MIPSRHNPLVNVRRAEVLLKLAQLSDRLDRKRLGLKDEEKKEETDAR